MTIKYVEGDVTQPFIPSGFKVVVTHCVNDSSAFGGGVSGAITRRWPHVTKAYLRWFDKNPKVRLPLGQIQIVKAEDSIYVCNLVGQYGVGCKKGQPPPVRYEAIRTGLDKLAQILKDYEHSRGPFVIAAPRLGAGLAGGSWPLIEPIIEESLKGFDVTIYDYTPPPIEDFLNEPISTNARSTKRTRV